MDGNVFQGLNRLSVLVLMLLLVLTNLLLGQNFVQNGGFEEHTSCPNSVNSLDKCKNWTNPSVGASPDYFNSCNSYNELRGYSVGIPKNFAGEQIAHTGNAYAGIALFAGDGDFYYREYLQTKLLSPLKKGSKYNFSFHLNLADNSMLYSDFISICFTNSENLIYKMPYATLSCQERVQINNVNFINQTDWVKVSGEYVAKGGEKYLTIGVF